MNQTWNNSYFQVDYGNFEVGQNNIIPYVLQIPDLMFPNFYTQTPQEIYNPGYGYEQYMYYNTPQYYGINNTQKERYSVNPHVETIEKEGKISEQFEKKQDIQEVFKRTNSKGPTAQTDNLIQNVKISSISGKSQKKKSETKNLLKNYGRAILTFIIKNNQLRKRVLEHCKIPNDQFIAVCKQFRKQIHTISEMRYLWQSHPYSQAFRILSCDYLRKHNLEHIFNSRIEKFSIHLKYQSKMMRSLESPKQFESIKDF